MENRPKLRGWKEGIITKDLRSLGGTTHKKGSIVRCKRMRVQTEFDRLLGDYEWHYVDQSNYNLIRSNEYLLEETDMKACKKPCNDCPFRKNSIPGWLADYTAKDLHHLVSNEVPFPCHTAMTKKNGWRSGDDLSDIGTDKNPLCAGALRYMKKSGKSPRNAKLAQLVSEIDRKDCENILSVPEFFKHHENVD